jgi:hypothetical protein
MESKLAVFHPLAHGCTIVIYNAPGRDKCTGAIQSWCTCLHAVVAKW